MAIGAQTMLDELNLDDDQEAIVTDLIAMAEVTIQRSVNRHVELSKLYTDPIFSRAVKTLVTQLYFDRSLEAGLSKGVLMMINQLKGTDFGGETSGETTNASADDAEG
ncbi:head-tail connector protein [Lacticaseibacillus hulanensis]|uniref:head-tail connector protein n=1 Tax=Lacticaseibacillus hulanensis TaxID=2493111 RepID=UPI0019D43782|nr:head-tail connector protein [Lacticaseibacillus hulanensis]